MQLCCSFELANPFNNDNDTFLDDLRAGETFNWVDRLSIELITQVLAKLFDFPWDERTQELERCFEKFAALWQQRLQAGQGTDLLSMMVFSEATKDLSAEEFLGNLISVIVGGNDATRNSFSGGVVAPNRFPDQYEKLRQNPELIESMVPEIIRWQTPISHMARTAREDYEIGGKTIKAGDRVALWYISGNRDENAITDPETFIIDRKKARQHLSFGFGAHHCIGYHVAELQLKVAWQEIQKRFRCVELVGEPKRVCSNIIHGYTDLPVRLHRW